jgi:methionyl aminopeptidase
MSIIIKTSEQIDKMKVAGKLAAQVLEMIEPHVQPGVTTEQLDQLCHDFIVNEQKATPAPLYYPSYNKNDPNAFPKSICTSINHVVCHGIPGSKKLKKGDCVNIDVTVIKDGYHGDTSKMFVVGGTTSILAQRLIKVTHECLWAGIDIVKPGTTLGDIGYAIQTIAHKNNFSVVEAFCGHGIGEGFHEEPQVLHYGKPNSGIKLKEGMIFTIEPMINAGKKNVTVLKDGWTAVTKDKSLSAQWEHTILVTPTGHEVLTLRNEEKHV